MLVGVILLSGAAAALVLAGADRLLAAVAVRQVARRMAALTGAAAAPAVRIGSVPFLTQLAAGLYREVEISIAAFNAGGVALCGLRARLWRVRAPLRLLRAGGGLVAERVDAVATLPLSVIGDRLPPGLVVRRHGSELRLAGFVLLMPVSGTLAIKADGQRISVVPRVLGVPSLVSFVIAIPGLPPELVIESVRVTETGVELALRGENVSLTAP